MRRGKSWLQDNKVFKPQVYENSERPLGSMCPTLGLPLAAVWMVCWAQRAPTSSALEVKWLEFTSSAREEHSDLKEGGLVCKYCT